MSHTAPATSDIETVIAKTEDSTHTDNVTAHAEDVAAYKVNALAHIAQE